MSENKNQEVEELDINHLMQIRRDKLKDNKTNKSQIPRI